MSDQYRALTKAISDGNQETGVAEVIALLDGGKKPIDLFTECIEPLLDEIGGKFSRLEIFLPEMINSSKVVKAIHEAVKPYLESDQLSSSKGKVIIATVSGDLHDIGKNIVKAMLEVNGFEVKDLGVDVSTQTIINNAKEISADIIALSALMLPSLPFVKDVIDFVGRNKNFKVIVGGGPVSQEWADEAGAAGYGDNAMDAVALVKAIMG